MMKEWCGKECWNCDHPCHADEQNYCSPDCGYVGDDGTPLGGVECAMCDIFLEMAQDGALPEEILEKTFSDLVEKYEQEPNSAIEENICKLRNCEELVLIHNKAHPEVMYAKLYTNDEESPDGISFDVGVFDFETKELRQYNEGVFWGYQNAAAWMSEQLEEESEVWVLDEELWDEIDRMNNYNPPAGTPTAEEMQTKLQKFMAENKSIKFGDIHAEYARA